MKPNPPPAQPARHTPGALRAAEAINSQLSAANVRIATERFAGIIDRETLAPAMLEALRQAEAALSDRGRWVSDDAQAAYLACSRAIQQAEGRT